MFKLPNKIDNKNVLFWDTSYSASAAKWIHGHMYIKGMNWQIDVKQNDVV